MPLDNDLLDLWCRAIVLDEQQVRDVVQMVQDGRDALAEAEDDIANAEDEEQQAAASERNTLKAEIDKLRGLVRSVCVAITNATDILSKEVTSCVDSGTSPAPTAVTPEASTLHTPKPARRQRC